MEQIDMPYLIKDTKILHLSTQRTSSILNNGEYKSNVSYDCRGYLNFENDNSVEYVTVEMPYAVMTNSNYIINEYNNTLIVNWGLVGLQTYYLTQGNYTVTTFIQHLYTFLPQSGGWNITADPVTNVFTFTNSMDSFLFSGDSTCDYILGFTGSQTCMGSSPFTLTMPRCYNFLPIPRYVIHCNVLSDGILLGTNGTMGSSDILATIPNNAKLNGQIIYENVGTEFIVKTHNWPLLTIYITDDNNRLINFNGISSYFVLKFNIFRKSIKKPLPFSNLAEQINKINPEQLIEEE